MVCTDDDRLFELSLLKRSHGLARELPADRHAAHKAAHPDVPFDFLFLTDGFNVRNTEFNAVLGLAQLARLDEFIRIRNRNYARFLEICEPFEDELILLRGSGVSSFVLPFIFRISVHRAALEQLLRSEGIESRPLISGNLLRQPVFAQFGAPAAFPVADLLHTNAFYVGNNQFVNESRLDWLSGLLVRFFSAVAVA